MPSGPTVSALALMPTVGSGNSVRAPAGVIRPIAPGDFPLNESSGNQRLPSGPTVRSGALLPAR